MHYLYEMVVRINKFRYIILLHNTFVDLDPVHNTFVDLYLMYNTFKDLHLVHKALIDLMNSIFHVFWHITHSTYLVHNTLANVMHNTLTYAVQNQVLR
jgi:hypothetical protein